MPILLDKLTPEQTAVTAPHAAEWTRVGLSTEPADWARADAAFNALYARMGWPKPLIIHVQSPMAVQLARVPLKNLASVWASVRASVWDSVGDSVGDKNLDYHVMFGKCTDADWLAFYEFFALYCPTVAHLTEPQREMWEIAKSCGCWVPYHKDGVSVVIVSDRPSAIHLTNNRLHCETGPAYECRDGWGVWAVNGVRVDEQTVMRPETLTTKQIDAETNVEKRRIMRERFGTGRYLRETGATVVDMDAVEVSVYQDCGSMPRALMRARDGKLWLCGTDGSTKRVYYMRAPDGVRNCDEAERAIRNPRYKNAPVVAQS
jgi:hypothetical protein